MEKLSVEDVKKILRYKVIPYRDEILKLKKGEGLRILKTDWLKKTPPDGYYRGIKDLKGKVKIIKTGDSIIIIKL